MNKQTALPDNPENHLVVFQEKAIRRTWHNEEWWFSVVDVCGVLTDSPDAGAYWRKLKQRLGAEGSEVVTFCHGLKLEAPDGKQRVTDCANSEALFRIIQSIPSPKVEPLKRWLAKVGKEKAKGSASNYFLLSLLLARFASASRFSQSSGGFPLFSMRWKTR